MPTFLNPPLLWGLGLVALPVIIHLINLLRHRRVRASKLSPANCRQQSVASKLSRASSACMALEADLPIDTNRPIDVNPLSTGEALG